MKAETTSGSTTRVAARALGKLAGVPVTAAPVVALTSRVIYTARWMGTGRLVCPHAVTMEDALPLFFGRRKASV